MPHVTLINIYPLKHDPQQHRVCRVGTVVVLQALPLLGLQRGDELCRRGVACWRERSVVALMIMIILIVVIIITIIIVIMMIIAIMVILIIVIIIMIIVIIVITSNM